MDWEALARRWATDYGLRVLQRVDDVARTRRGARALLPPALRSVLSIHNHRLIRRELPSADCGSHAWLPLFADDPEAAAQSLGLRLAETGGNVLIVRPYDPVVFERAEYENENYIRSRHSGPIGPHDRAGTRTRGGGGSSRVDAGQ